MIIAFLTAISLAACSDANMASWEAIGEQSDVKCYSGGNVIFQDTSTGKVYPMDGDGLAFRSDTTGKYVRAYADCIISNK
jgi:hypothetical protein